MNKLTINRFPSFGSFSSSSLPRIIEFYEFKVSIFIEVSLKEDTFAVYNDEMEILCFLRSSKNPVVLASCISRVSFAEVSLLVTLLYIKDSNNKLRAFVFFGAVVFSFKTTIREGNTIFT
jgi:hypothetical protein